MHRPSDDIAAALLQLVSFLNDPRQDGRLLAEADLDCDPAFLPLLVRLGAWGEAGVVELAGHIGRDHSTISRQITRLAAAGLVTRTGSEADGRIRKARLTPKGETAIAALSGARQRLLDRALADWPGADRAALAALLTRFVGALTTAASIAGPVSG